MRAVLGIVLAGAAMGAGGLGLWGLKEKPAQAQSSCRYHAYNSVCMVRNLRETGPVDGATGFDVTLRAGSFDFQRQLEIADEHLADFRRQVPVGKRLLCKGEILASGGAACTTTHDIVVLLPLADMEKRKGDAGSAIEMWTK